MVCTVSKKDLAKVLANVATATAKQAPLACVRLEATGGAMHLFATNLFMSREGRIACEAKREGVVCADAKALLERVRAMPDGPLELTVEGDRLSLRASGAKCKFTLAALRDDDFPPLPPPFDGAELTLPAAVLARGIRFVYEAISNDETRAHLNSMLLEWEGQGLRFVATDGHRLAVRDEKVEGMAHVQALIPKAHTKEIRALAESIGEAPISIRIAAREIAFATASGDILRTKPVEATFPPYAQILPKDSKRTVQVTRSTAMDVARAVKVAARADSAGLRLSFAKGSIAVSAQSPDNGAAEDEIPCDGAVKLLDGFAIGLNADYLLDALESFTCDEVSVGLHGDLDPVVFKPSDGGDAERVVVMPIRLDS